MSTERMLRLALAAAGVFTLIGAVMFGMPSSWPASLAGLPAEVPPIYRLLAALMMVLFGTLSLWLSVQPRLPLQMVTFAALAKLLAFAAILVLWLAGGVAGRTLGAVSGDLLFALLFLYGAARMGAQSDVSNKRGVVR
ncbi:hypothetical protein GCM10011521_20290 [Arenimonas soli]|uniref:DUF4345 domain-containing protein n=1 Tax=Arenimonas soli TaxID=2269504 RepID=A0ABQ1HLA2_9GAMM|nr:hypothetical protein [Arenimonas soli]GGA81883.1 hypothetical protein GCM10011521_20290 [Arenimonas soli]